MTRELRAALDRVYVVFAHYKDPQNIVTRCHISRTVRQLTRADWEHMDSEFDMMVYIYSDKEQMFRHYLPLLLEWECGGQGVTDLDFPLNWAHWRQWPVEEVEALREVFEEWIRDALSQQDRQIPLYFLLEVEDDLARYLNHWVKARPLDATQWLWTHDWRHVQEMVFKWAVQPLVAEEIESAFWANPDGKHAALFSRTLELLGSIRSLRS